MAGVPTSKVITAPAAAASLSVLATNLRRHGAAGPADRQLVEALARLAVVRQAVVKMRAVGLERRPRQQCLDGGADAAHHARIDPAPAAKVLGPQIYLRDHAIRRVELPVGEVSAQHGQHVAVHHGAVAGAEADQPGHAHVERVVPFHSLLAARRMHDRRLERVSQAHQRRMRPVAAAPAQQRDAVGLVEQLGQFVQLAVSRVSQRRP